MCLDEYIEKVCVYISTHLLHQWKKCQKMDNKGFFFLKEYLFERVTGRQRERDLLLLMHSPNGSNGQDWARQEPGAPAASPVSAGA